MLTFKALDSADPAVRVHELSACQLSLERDLVEVGNLDVMLKDPRLLRVARSFERSFSVLEHRKAAEQRLHLLEDHTRDLTEFARERATRRLEILFSLSAAGTIAALIPALAQINFPLSFTIITILLLVLLGVFS
jgi:HEAT repeat protein